MENETIRWSTFMVYKKRQNIGKTLIKEGYWLKLGVVTCFLQCSVEREPQEITRQMYIFLERY